MANTTKFYRKDTFWYQLLLFLSGLVAYFQGDSFVIESLGTNVGVLAMASSLINIGLSFTKPRPGHEERLKKLNDEHENEAV